MDPTENNTSEDTRDQPWKQWVEDELKTRKKADEIPEGRPAQEERVQAFKKKSDEGSYDDSSNKAG